MSNDDTIYKAKRLCNYGDCGTRAMFNILEKTKDKRVCS